MEWKGAGNIKTPMISYRYSRNLRNRADARQRIEAIVTKQFFDRDRLAVDLFSGGNRSRLCWIHRDRLRTGKRIYIRYRFAVENLKSETIMKIVFPVLLLSSLSLVFPRLTEIDLQEQKGASAYESDKFPVVEHDGIVVTLLEESVSRSPDGKQIVNAFLFMVENRTTKPTQLSIQSPFRFFSNDRERYRDADKGIPKTRGTSYEYNRQRLPEFDDLPNPLDETKTILYRYRLHDELPQSVNALEAGFGFGHNGEIKTFRFPINRR